MSTKDVFKRVAIIPASELTYQDISDVQEAASAIFQKPAGALIVTMSQRMQSDMMLIEDLIYTIENLESNPVSEVQHIFETLLKEHRRM